MWLLWLATCCTHSGDLIPTWKQKHAKFNAQHDLRIIKSGDNRSWAYVGQAWGSVKCAMRREVRAILATARDIQHSEQGESCGWVLGVQVAPAHALRPSALH